MPNTDNGSHDPSIGTEDVPGRGRRHFLGTLWYLLGGAVLAEAVWIVSDFLRPRARRTTRGESIVVAGPVDRFERGSVTAFQNGGFYLARLPSGGFLALSRECTHLGCTVGWDEEQGRFVCPCHASVYDLEGRVLRSPAPRPLDLYAVRIENRVVKVDTSTRTRRSTYDASQVADG